MGLVLCPERRRLFPRMTVGDNVMAGAFLRNDGDDVKRDLERTMGDFPDHQGKMETEGGNSAVVSSRWWLSRGPSWLGLGF